MCLAITLMIISYVAINWSTVAVCSAKFRRHCHNYVAVAENAATVSCNAAILLLRLV